MGTQREELRQEDKERLIDTIELLNARVNSLEKQVRELKKLLQLPSEAAVRVEKTPKNSSKPSGSSYKAQLPKRVAQKRGPKVGHVGQSRANSPADEVVDCQAKQCSECGEVLEGLAQRVIGSRQVIEIPPFAYTVREARCYEVDCPNCGARQRGTYPAGFEAGQTFGARLEQVVLYLHHAHPLSYQRVQHIMRDLYGLHLSVGALVNMVQRHAEVVHTAAEEIRQQVKQAAVVGSDETSVRINGQNCWQWVFQTAQWVYMRIHQRRASSVIGEVLQEAQPEVWVSDLGPMQLDNPAGQLQVCLAHQGRDLQYAIDAYRCRWAYRLQALLWQAIRLGQRRQDMVPQHFTTQRLRVHQQLQDLLAIYPNNPDSQRLHARFTKHQASLFVFLHRSDVPPTNNASEQALRNSVIYRKLTGGFRTFSGAHVYADLLSILESARRQHRSFFDTLALILSGQPLFLPLRE
jgi:transposase